ncbi:MAG: glycosyltransferase [Pirellulales bacterium]|nr:glycosyltransferase [Pirellulales bacterium]
MTLAPPISEAHIPPAAASAAPRRVLYLINTLGTGGTERNVRMFCQHIDQSRYLPEVWVLKGGGEFEHEIRDAGIAVRDLNRNWARSPWFALKTAWQISRQNVDLVHAFLPTIATYAALGRLMFGLRVPLIMSLGTTKMANSKEEVIIRRFFPLTIDHIFANSTSVAAYAKNLGFQESQTTIIPNGHNPHAFLRPINKEAVRDALGISSDEWMLIHVGRLIDTKRLEDLIDAVALLEPRQYKFRVVLAGSGPLLQSLQGRIAELNLQHRFMFLGNRADVPDLLRAADMFVFPSEVEGLPNSIIEAGMARLPIVACQIMGVTDVLRDGQEGLLVPPRSPAAFAGAIQKMIEDPELAGRLAAAAQQHCLQTYSIQGTLDKLYAAYDKCLEKNE